MKPSTKYLLLGFAVFCGVGCAALDLPTWKFAIVILGAGISRNFFNKHESLEASELALPGVEEKQ